MELSNILSVIILEVLALYAMCFQGIPRYRSAKTIGERKGAQIVIIGAIVLLVLNPIRLFI